MSEADNSQGVDGCSTQKRRQNKLEPFLVVELVELGRLKNASFDEILSSCFSPSIWGRSGWGWLQREHLVKGKKAENKLAKLGDSYLQYETITDWLTDWQG